MKDNISQITTKRNFILPDCIVKSERRPTLLSYAAALRARGYNEEEIYLRLIAANRERCDPPLDRRGEHDLRRIATWIARKPAGVVRSGIASEDVQRAIEQARSVVLSFPWRGCFARTCRDVLLVLLSWMEQINKTRIFASARELAELSGYSWKTVARALRALSGKDRHRSVPVLLYRFPVDCREDPKHANTYSLRRHNIAELTHPYVKENQWERGCVKMAMFPDAFRGKRGMSKSCARALEAIETQTVRSASDLADKTGLTLHTAQRSITALRAEKLIEKHGRHWLRMAATLEETARRRGTFGYTKAQKIRHQRDRDIYHGLVSGPRGGLGKLKLIAATLHDTKGKPRQDLPEPLWEPGLKQAASWKPYRKDSSRERQEGQG